MKHVFSNDMVAHVWAQRSQPSGYTSTRSYSFDGAVLLSYSTPIAAFVQGTRKRTACLISDNTFSVTTARHISRARQAVSGVPVFLVPHLMNDRYSRQPLQVKENKKQHKENLAFLVREYVELGLRFKRAKTLYGIHDEAGLADRLAESAQIARFYADMFGLKMPNLGPNTDASTIWAYRVERDARFATPEHQAKLETERERREIRKAEVEEKQRQANYADAQSRFVRYMLVEDDWIIVRSHEFPADSIERRYMESAQHARDMEAGRAWKVGFDLWMAGNGPLPEDRNPHAVLSVDEDKAWQDAKAAAVLAKYANEIAEWRNGGGRATYHVSYNVPTMLRIRGEMVETSKGAEFPISHALRAIPLVLRCRERGIDWHRNGHTVHLGSFQIDSIDAFGNVTAGCHVVMFDEIERLISMLRELGRWADIEVSLTPNSEDC